MCFAPQQRAIFHLSSGELASHPPLQRAYVSTLRSHKTLEKTECFATFLFFAHLHLLLVWLSPSLIFSFLTFSTSEFFPGSASSWLCFSSAHIVGTLVSKLWFFDSYIILLFTIIILRARFAMLPYSALFILVKFSCWPRCSERLAWQVFSTQGVANQIRTLPAVFGAFWAQMSIEIIAVSVKLNSGFFVTAAHEPLTCEKDLPKLWPTLDMPTGICTSMQLFASRLVWFQANHAVFGCFNPWDALEVPCWFTGDFQNARIWRSTVIEIKQSLWIPFGHLLDSRGLAQKSYSGSWFEGPPVENSERIECSVLDALDEAQLYWKGPAETA